VRTHRRPESRRTSELPGSGKPTLPNRLRRQRRWPGVRGKAIGGKKGGRAEGAGQRDREAAADHHRAAGYTVEQGGGLKQTRSVGDAADIDWDGDDRGGARGHRRDSPAVRGGAPAALGGTPGRCGSASETGQGSSRRNGGGRARAVHKVRENSKGCSTFEKTARAVHQSKITARAVHQTEITARAVHRNECSSFASLADLDSS
jgi:hypothetical protein